MTVNQQQAAGSSQAPHPRCTCGLIDVHAHCLPPAYKDALAKAGLTSLDGGFPVPDWSPAAAIEVMDRNGIDTMLLSVSSPSVHFLPNRHERVAFARQLNEDIAATVAAHPGRFGGFATLPLPHVPDCLEEIGYALDDLGLDGVVLETNTDGRYLGDTAFAPVLEAIADRGVALFLHPTSPACFEAVGLGRPAPLFEFPVDTARTVIDMIFGGVFERTPDLKVILPHAGGVLPAIARRIALLSRMPQMQPAPMDGAAVTRVFARLFYDLAMAADPASFAALRTLAPLSQIVFGTDYPFQPPDSVEANVQHFRTLEGLSTAEHRAIARDTALQLFPRLRTAHRKTMDIDDVQTGTIL